MQLSQVRHLLVFLLYPKTLIRFSTLDLKGDETIARLKDTLQELIVCRDYYWNSLHRDRIKFENSLHRFVGL